MDDYKSDPKPELQPVVPSLKNAIRRARIDEAERSSAVAELRGAEIARLEVLAEMLEPVFAQVPEDVDIFDAGVLPGARPRLYIDMIAFVEMAADKRTYQLIQSTRHGRVISTVSEKPAAMIAAVTNYVARRLLEREQALAGDRTVEDAARALIARERMGQSPSAASGPVKSGDATTAPPLAEPAGPTVPTAQAVAAVEAPSNPRRGFLGGLIEAAIFLAELIGFVVLLVALFGALYFAWTMGEAWWIAWFRKLT